MKDRAFTGRDVAEAVKVAAETLGLPEAQLRYFVLDPGRPGTLGVAPSPATIAVLMDAPSTAGGSSRPREREGRRPEVREHGRERLEGREQGRERPEAREREPLGPRLGRVARALRDALGSGVSEELSEDRDAVTLRLVFEEPGFLLGPDGDGAPARALEHVLQRTFAHEVTPLKVRVDLPGFKEAREEALRALVEKLAAEVRRDQEPRTTAPLNAYERRIVHMTAAILGGVTTHSEGEGAERRVVLRPAAPPSTGGEIY